MADLPQLLSEGVEALRDGNPDRAVETLRIVADDPQLAAAQDLQDIRLRVLTLYAQALLDAGQASAARHPLQGARDLAATLGASEAAAAIEELEARIGEAISATFAAQARSRTLRALAARPVEELLAEAPADRHPALLVERAAAALEVDRPEEAVELAERALDLATEHSDLRHQVMALLALSRAQPARIREHLEEARRRCDEADAFDLLAFVVRAAEEADLSLATAGVHDEDPT